MSSTDSQSPTHHKESQQPLRRLKRAESAANKARTSQGDERDLADQLQALSLKQKPIGRFKAAIAARKPIAGETPRRMRSNSEFDSSLLSS